MGQFNEAGNANGQQMLYFDQGQNIQNSQINYIENFLEDNSDEDNLGAAWGEPDDQVYIQNLWQNNHLLRFDFLWRSINCNLSISDSVWWI